MYFLPQISVNVVKILVGLQDERDLDRDVAKLTSSLVHSTNVFFASN